MNITIQDLPVYETMNAEQLNATRGGYTPNPMGPYPPRPFPFPFPRPRPFPWPRPRPFPRPFPRRNLGRFYR